MSVEVTVVIPTFRRPLLLERCLRTLERQRLAPLRYEIVVADDGAEAATRAAVERRRRGGTEVPIRYVAVRGRHGPAAARNAGWRAAAGEVIAFTDDDCIPEPGWLAAGLAALAEREAVWGRVVVPLPLEPSDYQMNAARLQKAEFTTANCFCRRAALEAIGGLDERFTQAWREDSDLYFSLLERGARVGRAERAVVVHPIRPAPWGVSLAQQRKIRFDALLYKKHPALYRRHIRAAPPWGYYLNAALLLLFPFALLQGGDILAAASGAGWLLSTGRFCRRRLEGTSRRLDHLLEMALTSALIPTLAVFWRLFGALRFRVPFL